MLDYFYTLEYAVDTAAELDDIATHAPILAGPDTSTASLARPALNHGVLHAQMYAMGDKYDSSALKQYATRRFRKVIVHQSRVCPTDLAASISEAYETTLDTDRGLRGVVLEVVGENVVKLARDEAFSRLVVEIPCFGWEMLQWEFREERCAQCIEEFRGLEPLGTAGRCFRHIDRSTISFPYVCYQGGYRRRGLGSIY